MKGELPVFLIILDLKVPSSLIFKRIAEVGWSSRKTLNRMWALIFKDHAGRELKLVFDFIRINHKRLAPSAYTLKYKWRPTWQHAHKDDKSERNNNTYRSWPPSTWQSVNFEESPKPRRHHLPFCSLPTLLHIDLLWCWKTVVHKTCHSVVKVINNVGLFCVPYVCCREQWFP